MAPHAGEAGEEILELGEFDLQSALAGAGSGGENVENQLAAVDDLAVGDFFEIPALRGRKLIVENHGGRLFFSGGFGDFLGLAFADVERRGGFVQPLDHSLHDLRPGGVGEQAEFLERVLQIPARDALVLESYENDALGRGDHGAWAARISRARGRADSGWGRAVKSSEGKLNCVRHQVNWRLA